MFSVSLCLYFQRVRPFGPVEVERADSGVGSETSKPTVSKRHWNEEVEEVCADCDQQLENGAAEDGQCCPLVCRKCDKKRSERKEIVTEIVETEFKYGKDLMVIKEVRKRGYFVYFILFLNIISFCCSSTNSLNSMIYSVFLIYSTDFQT